MRWGGHYHIWTQKQEDARKVWSLETPLSRASLASPRARADVLREFAVRVPVILPGLISSERVALCPAEGSGGGRGARLRLRARFIQEVSRSEVDVEPPTQTRTRSW